MGWSKHNEWKVHVTTKHLLKENRMIKLSHPLFEGGTAEVTLDRLAVNRQSQATSARCHPQTRDVNNRVNQSSWHQNIMWNNHEFFGPRKNVFGGSTLAS